MTNKRLIVKFQKGRTVDRSNWFATLEKHTREVLGDMLSTRLCNTLRITIKFRKTNLEKRGAMGTASSHKHNSKSRGAKSKHFEICINPKYDLRACLNTLTHELAHVAQYATGRLTWVYLKGTRTYYDYWRPVGHTGASVKYPNLVTHVTKVNGRKKFKTEKVSLPWHERPWEIEAMAMEKKYHYLLDQNSEYYHNSKYNGGE